jgi:hypothetical protein
MLAQISELKRRAAEADRDVSITLYAAPAKAARLERYAEAGVDGAVFLLPSADRGAIDERLEWVQGQIAPFVGV